MHAPHASPRALAAVVLISAATLWLSACGRSANNNGGPVGPGVTSSASDVDGVQQITVKAGDDYKFVPSTITVHPGSVKVTMVNSGNGAPHNLQFPGQPTDTWVPLTSAGQTNSVTFTAPAPGTYQFVCSIHERQGQTGELVVLPK